MRITQAGHRSFANSTIDLTRVGNGGGVTARFRDRAVEEHLFTASGCFRTEEPGQLAVDLLTSAPFAGEITSVHNGPYGTITEIAAEEWAALVEGYDGDEWDVEVSSAASLAVAQKVLAAVRELAPAPAARLDGSIPLSVWSESLMGGGARRHARAHVGGWTQVAANYPGEVGGQLATLAATLPARDAGGLVVFCGTAGTGKTRAVEAMLASWCATADIGLVVDADRLLGSAAYLADVMASAGERRQVVVVEDCDDLIAKGPKSPAAAKLLNVADGLLGRCSGSAGTLWVLTANLEADQIADYMTRPGRAAAVVPFRSFTAEEATAWHATRGVELEVTCDVALASLYNPGTV